MKRIISIFLILVFILPAGISADNNPPMRVHFIDVGRGDSILIETPEGKTILIDGGQQKEGNKVVDYLNEANIEEIDLMIATHPHFDHIGGLIDVMKEFPVKQIINNGWPEFTKTYFTYRWTLFRERIPSETVKEKERIQLDDKLDIQVLNAAGDIEDNNQSSIVLKISYETIDFLLMSDVEAEQEREIRKEYDVEAEILKAAHHGFNANTMEFLREVNPEAAIITYSQDNGDEDPEERVMNNFNKLNTEIYSTATSGNILVETDGIEYEIKSGFKPAEEQDK